MSLVVILDSGLDVSYINTHQIIGGVTFYKYNNVISMRSDSYHDNLGHGTAIYNIISKKCKNSKFFIIKIFDTSFECDPDLFKSALEYIQNNFNSSIIVIPSGAILIDNRVKIKEHIDALYHTGSIIISAFNNQNAISYPAAFESVIGVDTSPSITSEQGYIVIKGSPVDILFKEHSYRIKWKNNITIIDKGNSYAAAECATLIIQAYDFLCTSNKEELLKFIQNKNYNVNFINLNWETILNPIASITSRRLKAIAFPFSKEIRALASNEDLLNLDIVGYYDIRQSGHVGFSINKILNYSSNTKIINDITKLDWTNSNFDLIICGHCNQINILTKNNWLNELLHSANCHEKKLYSFDYIKNISDNHLCIPKINKYTGNTFGKMWNIEAPVISVFGTSSVQGKFSLQLSLRRKFIKEGYSVAQISTEPTGTIFGMDFTCPIGYNSQINLSGNEAALFFNEIVHRCDLKNPDIIITGCQSATIPHNLFHTSYLTFPQYEFLVGINPDAVLLVVNSFDEINYIKNTIDFIESSIGTQVIGCIISPVQKNGVHCEFKNANDLSKILCKEVWEYKEITNKVFTAIINFFGGV